jgi:ubiquinone/menaquinone biosynthesis C-methylase UbiE
MQTRRNRVIQAFMRLFYRLLYHQMAWSYDIVAWTVSLGNWQNWVKSVLPYLKGPRVLELGHGPGHLQANLLRNDKQIGFMIGLDRSHHMGKMAYRKLRRKGLAPALVNGAAQKLPFGNETFDQVVATFPTDYIVHPDTVSEIKRILVPGGKMVVLPLAWITGKRLPERAAAGLFQITGQAPEWDERAIKPVQEAGFEVKVEWIHQKSSMLVLILAKKPHR